MQQDSDHKIKGRVILVTGGGSGIGRATCLLFAQDGDAVAILDCDAKGGEETAELIRAQNGKAIFIHADVSVAEQVEGAVSRTVAEFGSLDILFVNAATQSNAPLEETSLEDWNRMLAVNLTGAFLCCKAATAPMKQRGNGCIVICSSGHAFHTYPKYAGYAATKAGLLAFMRSIAIDLAPYGIRVNGLIPGSTDTPLLRYHLSHTPEDEARLLARIPMHRFATPKDIAQGVRLLASPDASYITGTWLTVDGGLLAQG